MIETFEKSIQDQGLMTQVQVETEAGIEVQDLAAHTEEQSIDEAQVPVPPINVPPSKIIENGESSTPIPINMSTIALVSLTLASYFYSPMVFLVATLNFDQTHLIIIIVKIISVLDIY